MKELGNIMKLWNKVYNDAAYVEASQTSFVFDRVQFSLDFEMISLILLGITLLAVGWYYVRQQYSYWERQGFPCDKNASFPFGCLGSVWRREKAMGMALHDVYLKSKERFLGTYMLYRPAVLIRDAELARRVLAQDFSSFHDRGVYVDEQKDPLSASIFALRGQSWRFMRNKLSPCFTSGKLKAMYSTSEDIGNKMISHLEKTLPAEGIHEVDLKAVIQTYAIDIIASTIFGLDINSYEHPENKFKKIVTFVRSDTKFTAIVGMMIFLIPS